jgi:hypothetical protein
MRISGYRATQLTTVSLSINAAWKSCITGSLAIEHNSVFSSLSALIITIWLSLTQLHRTITSQATGFTSLLLRFSDMTGTGELTASILEISCKELASL